jgi:sugar fermentation stimulation protein A
VALEAAKATSLLEDWLSAGNSLLPGIGAVDDLQTEVTLGRHRIDIRGQGSDGREVWIEVKSGGRADGDVALLSETPSTRAAAHLALLGELVAEGKQAAVVFVVQRSDVRTLRIGGDADPGWIEAVTEARSAGVVVLAYGCNVTPTHIAIARDLPVVWS